LVERDRLIDAKVAHTRPSQLGQVRANVQTFAKIFRKGSDVSAGRTRNTSVKVEGAVEVVLDQLTFGPDRCEVVNTNAQGLSLDTLTATREFVEFFPFNFLR